MGSYVKVLGWRLRMWGLLKSVLGQRVMIWGFLCGRFRLEVGDERVVKWQFLGWRLKICGLFCHILRFGR